MAAPWDAHDDAFAVIVELADHLKHYNDTGLATDTDDGQGPEMQRLVRVQQLVDCAGRDLARILRRDVGAAA